jgi:hypothetical protein
MFTYDFIEKIGRINIKYSTKYSKRYLTFIEEFTNDAEYNEKLDSYLNGFRKEILNLPFKLTTKQSRKVFLNNLHDEFLLTKELLNTQFSQILAQSYNCIFKQGRDFKLFFPRYLQKKYLTKARDAYQKMHIVFSLQNDKIEIALAKYMTITFK